MNLNLQSNQTIYSSAGAYLPLSGSPEFKPAITCMIALLLALASVDSQDVYGNNDPFR